MKRFVVPALFVLPLLLAESAAAQECRPIEGLPPLLRPGNVLMLGELHGTRQVPAFALDVACHAARAGLPLVVGVELSPAEQPRLDAFLASDGSTGARDALLGQGLWSLDYQDGRTSRAMLEWIDGLRGLRRSASPSLRVVAFDDRSKAGAAGRESGMADRLIAAFAGSKEALGLVLTGDIHSRMTRGAPRDRSFEPMGFLVGEAIGRERVVALRVAHAGGESWICAPACGAVRIRGRSEADPWSIEIDERTRPAGHDGWFHVGPIDASLPAHPGRRAHRAEPRLRGRTGRGLDGS